MLHYFANRDFSGTSIFATFVGITLLITSAQIFSGNGKTNEIKGDDDCLSLYYDKNVRNNGKGIPVNSYVDEKVIEQM